MISSFCIVWSFMLLSALHTRAFLCAHLRSRLGLPKRFSKVGAFGQQNQYFIANTESILNPALRSIKSLDNDLSMAVTSDYKVLPASNFLWTSYRNGIQLDSLVLEDQFLGKLKYSDKETAQIWIDSIEARLVPKLRSGSLHAPLSHELDVAIDVVQRAAYVIRSLQQILLNPASQHPINRILETTPHSICSSKTDKTPVTVADFAIQALVIDTLSTAFPSDLFIAEEDSGVVRSDPAVREAVLFVLRAATGNEWSSERLYATLDKGSNTTGNRLSTPSAIITKNILKSQRVWVLDPIDGTKGFMRGEHCCTGLGLLVDGVTQLSVLGCPNLNLLRLLQGPSYDDKDIAYIDPAINISSVDTNDGEETVPPVVFHPHRGSVFYAVSKQGAFARSLIMPRGAAFEVTTSTVAEGAQARLCESAEALFGDREITARTAEILGVKKDYLRMDGMCKHCVVGVGAAEATLRLPPSGYREKIWDHVPGDHFVREAGGRVTDLNGKELDFSMVTGMNGNDGADSASDNSCRELGAEVQGVVVSNGHLHDKITETIRNIRLKLGRK